MEETGNFFYDYFNDKNNEPFIVTYRSKPIRGITLELMGINPNYIPPKISSRHYSYTNLGGYELR